MKFITFGTLNPKKKQTKRWTNAPENTGLWAFPYPYHNIGRCLASVSRSTYILSSSYSKSYYLTECKDSFGFEDYKPDMKQAKKFLFCGMIYTHIPEKPTIQQNAYFMFSDALHWELVTVDEYLKRLNILIYKIRSALTMAQKEYDLQMKNDPNFKFSDKVRDLLLKYDLSPLGISFSTTTVKDLLSAWFIEVFIPGNKLY